MGASSAPPPERLSDLEQQAIAIRPRFSAGRAVFLIATAVSIYLLAPSIVEVFSAWDALDDFNPLALPVVVVLEGLSFACVWLLQSIALRRERWKDIALSQLAANALSRVVPGGGATSTVVQARMLGHAGFDLTRAATALTVQSLMITAAVVALPVFVIPGMVMGTQLPENLLHAAWIGLGVFAVMAAVGTVLVATRRPFCALGGLIERLVNMMPVRRAKVAGLADRLLVERDEIRGTMGSRWPQAVGAAVGRWGFEYLVLLVALYAIDASPEPWSVLLAFSAAALLSQIPITPGGLGFVEAGLTAALTAAGIGAEKALAATLLFRLVSFWLPLPIGAIAGWAFRRRYRVLNARPA
jgi:uncharacterized protein (TIRG00374 family)